MFLDTVKRSINKIYRDDDLDIRNKLLIVLIIGIIIGVVLGSISDIVNGIKNLFFNGAMLIVCIISLVSCLKYQKYKFAMTFTVGAIDFCVLPFMFFNEGGMHSGMILWLYMSIIMTFLMLQGLSKYIISGIVILLDVGLFLIEYMHPEYVTKLDSESKFVTDVTISFATTTVVMCFLVLIHIKSYERQKIRIEEQWRELKKNKESLEAALEKAQSADQAKSDFLANMSHEIRTPINAVLGMDEMILRETDDPEIKEYAQNIESSSRALLSIINDILDFSKIEAGKMDLYYENYQITSVVNDVRNMIISRIQEKGLELRITNNPNLPYVLWGDEARLRQMIVNLMSNACKYTKVGTVVLDLDYSEISADEIMLKIAVADTGIGIKEENLQFLFQTFKRIDLKNNRKIEGTGLGLALTKSLAEQLGGSISVASEYGKGSTFTIEIPQKVIDRTPIGRIKELHADENKNVYRESFQAPDARILAVDDMKLNLKVLAGLLKATKINIDMAISGAECLKMVQARKYDIIFMDHMMPEMDGIETFANMKRMGDYVNADTPVIVLTANAIQGVKEQYLAEGFTDYLSKPVKYEALEAMMIKYLPAEKVILTAEK